MTDTPRYIEQSFPIVDVNPLSRKERYSYYPPYQMHKWYARRSASIFRAMLLGAALPSEEDGEPVDLMEEYFDDHRGDPRLRASDGEPLKVLDPFMGGGTTILEAARLGFDVHGADYNPISWFIVKCQTTPVDLPELDAAYERLADRVRDDLLDLYRTECPVTGGEADIVYGFWVKQGRCVDPDCEGVTDLFKSYEVARKTLSAKHFPDVDCPDCGGEFDWELERPTLTAGGPQVDGESAAGKNRPDETAYAFGRIEEGVDCPHCGHHLQAGGEVDLPDDERKRVRLRVVVDPTTGDFFEVRGNFPDEVTAPVSQHAFDPTDGPTYRGKFTCEACGRRQAIVDAAEANGEPLDFRYYGYLAHSPPADEADGALADEVERRGLDFNRHKWFAPVDDEDLEVVEEAKETLERRRDDLPLPDQEIPPGRNFRDLRGHMYREWSQLYGPRQLLALGTLLDGIAQEENRDLRDALLGAFQSHLDNVSNLTPFSPPGNKLERVTAAHDYRNPTTIAENNVWGGKYGRGTFSNSYEMVRDGYEYLEGNHFIKDEESNKLDVDDLRPDEWDVDLHSRAASFLETEYDAGEFDLIVTDPPYAGSVQYGEMSDLFYVWLHQVLEDDYDCFAPEITLKGREIIEDEQNKGKEEYFDLLTDAWSTCRTLLADDGLMAFTFHHKEGDRWKGLLRSLFESGFYLEAVYPTHSEALSSIVIQATGGITYDLVHVCRKRPDDEDVEPVAWTQLRKEIRAEAQAQLRRLEGQTDVLPGPDVWMVLLGKALKRYSQHWGKVLDHEGEPLEFEDALGRLRVLVQDVRGDEVPLPGPLRDADGLSQVYFLHVVGEEETWSRDGLHIQLRGYGESTDDLIEAELVEAVESGELAAVDPVERWKRRGDGWSGESDMPLVNRVHMLLGWLDDGRDPEPLIRNWWKAREPLKAALDYLADHDTDIEDLVEMAKGAIEAADAEEMEAGQQELV